MVGISERFTNLALTHIICDRDKGVAGLNEIPGYLGASEAVRCLMKISTMTAAWTMAIKDIERLGNDPELYEACLTQMFNGWKLLQSGLVEKLLKDINSLRPDYGGDVTAVELLLRNEGGTEGDDYSILLGDYNEGDRVISFNLKDINGLRVIAPVKSMVVSDNVGWAEWD